MTDSQQAREAPVKTILAPLANDPAFPDASDEPVLDVNNIQGNIIGGFNKDFQSLLILEIEGKEEFKRWLKTQVPFISTASEVLAFVRLFKAIRSRRRVESNAVKSTWINVAFSFSGIKKLVKDVDLNRSFKDKAFTDGLSKRSEAGILGDPIKDAKAEGNPKNWIVGGSNNDPADVIFIIASDDHDDMCEEVARIEESIYHFKTATGNPANVARVVFKEAGANLPKPLAGHEQFGNLDGVSQPGIRGRASDDPHDVVTPRQNPEKVDKNGKRTQGKPGQELLWPGEFVFGYVGQGDGGPNHDDIGVPTKDPTNAGPDWASNGSFLVFRRLRQDVFKFHSFVHDNAQAFGVDPLLVSSKLVGRWESGAPTVRNPKVDSSTMGDDDCANNDFEFNHDESTADTHHGPNDCRDNFPEKQFPKDDAADANSDAATGKRCPFDAHTRKAYPRNDLTIDKTPSVSEVDTQTRRLLRRGIPFGEVSRSNPNEPIKDNQDRGLHFLAYQTSIERQFEFVTQKWVNNPDFSALAAEGHECKIDGKKVAPIGHDPIIGQANGKNGDRTRTFFIRFDDNSGKEQCKRLTTKDDWVIPTGGGYFFAPSIKALNEKLSK
jgi:Dyp-type peroxidase family